MTNKNKRNLIFDKIASIYGLFYEVQLKNYNRVLDNLQNQLNFNDYKSIIDIGCGTGALCSALHKRGFDVIGVDPSQDMLNIAIEKDKNGEIYFINGNVLDHLPFEDKKFDMSISALVAHGLNKTERKIMYNEMKRISKCLVIFYDYNNNRSLLTDFIEWAEGGDYFNFIKNVERELLDNFTEFQTINVGKRTSLYICKAQKL